MTLCSSFISAATVRYLDKRQFNGERSFVRFINPNYSPSLWDSHIISIIKNREEEMCACSLVCAQLGLSTLTQLTIPSA